MKIQNILLLSLLSLSYLSCKNPTKSYETESSNPVKSVSIGTINIPDEKIGMGCITEYFKKNTNNKEELFMQTGAPDEKGWLNFLNINGTLVEFYTHDTSTLVEDDETQFTIKLENDQYQVIINAKMGETNIASDSTMAMGTIKVVDKKTKAESIVEFEGATVC